ncbi:DUF4336 domain-containing protein [Jannaschia sp. Os4]|uniref:DUF4336 domain-containing protein n=1 Tax=Jannaschia sp. Os4 TaxID=2807617 RepID=UPI00193AAB08|nr:DUF4336 domain-containing protein [Jannaschia sp. Os4]MBM2577082.1 DUF4336 domain-containing protein [Jannaschia sp. Os4]
MRRLAEGVWLHEGPTVRAAAGFPYPTRMAVLRAAGGLVVWSPTDPTPAVEEALDGMVAAEGPVVGLIAPTRLHDTWLADWQRLFPRARLWAAPGVGGDGVRVDDGVTALPEAFGVALWPTLIAREAVVLHRRSGTVLVADLIQQLSPRWFEGWRRWVARADLMTAPRPEVPRKFRVATRDRVAAKAARDRILGWEAERLVLAHGPVLETGARDALRHALRWL